MDGDDEFGDLYTDIGPEDGKTLDQYGGEGDGDMYDEDDEALLYGSSTPSLAPTSKAPSMPPSTICNSGLQTGLAEKEVDNDELLLYGQLYGVTLETTVKADSPMRRVESKPISSFRPEKIKDSLDSRVLESGEDNSFDLSEEDRLNSAGDLTGKSVEIPLGGVGGSAGGGERGLARDSIPFPPRMFDGFSNRALAPESNTTSSLRLPHVNDVSMQISSPPGLSSSAHIPAEFAAEDDIEEQHMREDWEEGDDAAGEGGGEAEAEEWDDSDSEDDLQIVLNDEAPMYAASERPVDGDVAEGSEDEDEEDLVIVAGDDDGPIEEQEWEEQPLATDVLPGLSGAPIPLGSDRPPGAEERASSGKGSGAGGVSPGVPRIGYSGQGYHAHHMQYKYVRPGAAVSSGIAPPSQGSPQPSVSGGRGAPGVPVGGWGPGKGGSGRGDWSSGGGRGSSGPRPSQGGGGMTPWGSSRGFPNGMEFNLPPTKTVFDVDLDGLEDKPWRRPGVDMTDYFNFGFNENTWKQYCRQLAQLRLEATMQSKIRVYESGRSEQEYDPDLPPELAAAAGIQESGDPNMQQQRPQDGGPGGGGGRGRGAGRARMMPPAGRAIQVEGGGGERRPSADVRRQRTRDSDAVIQIVLQDASEEDLPALVPTLDSGIEDYIEEDEDRGGGMHEQERRFYRPGGPPPWEMEGPPNMWDRENMPMGPGGMPMGPHGGGMMPGHRMDVEGPGPFPVGPGMAMHQPGPGPNFGMFPGGPFGPPPVGRGGMVRPPLYNGPRPALSLPVQGPPPEVFPPVMVPLEYHEPPRRRTPPHLTPRRTPPQGLPMEWDEEPSNGSGANWGIRDPRNLRENKEYDGNGDWPVDDGERRDGAYPARRVRDPDRSTLRERSVDEPSVDHRSEEHKRSMSRDRHVGENDWDGGYSSRNSKKQKVQIPAETRSKDYTYTKPQKSNPIKEEPTHSWDLSKERMGVEEEVSQQRRLDAGHNKSVERKGPISADDSYGAQRKEPAWNSKQDADDSYATQRKESTWNSRPDEESKERRQHREREEAHRRKLKEEDSRQHRSREDQERERRTREDLDRERRHGRKEKEDERLSRSDRSKRHGDDHSWTSRERDESRAREEAKRASAEREAERLKEKRRREDDRGKVKGRLEDPRDSDGRGRRYDRDDDIRNWDDRRKYDEKGSRVDNAHVARNHSIESRRTGDDPRSHKDKRGWEGTSTKEIPGDRNGSLSGVGDDKNYRSHTDGSKKRKVEEYRTSAQFDKASTRDPDELAASSARHRDKKVGPPKRGQDDHFIRRPQEKDSGSRQHRGSKDDKPQQLDTGSSEDEEEERRGRSKLERWTSRKERDAVAAQGAENRKKYQGSDVGHEEAPSTSQQAGSDRQQRFRGQDWKDDRKEKQRLPSYSSGKRHSDSDAKESSTPVAAAVAGGDSAPDPQPAIAKDIAEKRKERIERLRLQAAERQKNGEDSVPQAGSVEEVKQERPARKRRWGNG
ncbi:hypothetical protein Mapa_006695 [Marchantia paleacea]|nr:hypothetical protein Mapa_006695 [Marchantia paleacea]